MDVYDWFMNYCKGQQCACLKINLSRNYLEVSFSRVFEAFYGFETIVYLIGEKL